jgi:hypothetical protein
MNKILNIKEEIKMAAIYNDNILSEWLHKSNDYYCEKVKIVWHHRNNYNNVIHNIHSGLDIKNVSTRGCKKIINKYKIEIQKESFYFFKCKIAFDMIAELNTYIAHERYINSPTYRYNTEKAKLDKAQENLNKCWAMWGIIMVCIFAYAATIGK